jgi:hypothetical protein
VQQFDPLGCDCRDQQRSAGGISLRSTETGHEAILDRVGTDREDDRDIAGRGLGGERCYGPAGCNNYRHSLAHKLGREPG